MLFYSDIDPNFDGYNLNYKNFVNDSYIDAVENYIKNQQLEKAEFNHNDSDTDLDAIRRSKIHWMTDERYKDDLMPLYNELTTKIRQVNNRQWKWIIDGWDAFQYSEYDESYKGHYDWHIDYTMKTPDQPLSRKISFSLGISEKDEYEGGELITKMNMNENSCKLDKGEVFVFPSWMLHKVTPVTKGKRKVIVGWGLGPVV